MTDIKYNYENLVFESGGIKGLSYIGTIKILEELEILNSIKRYAGSSVGSIFAVLLCLGYTYKELCDIENGIKNNILKNKCICTTFCNLFRKKGLYKNNIIKNLISKILQSKVDPNITLLDLYRKTGKDLVIIACNLNNKKGIYFHYCKYPDIKLIDAIMCSICIPGLITPYKIKNEYFVDGSIIESYPIWIFNNMDLLYRNKILDIDRYNIPNTTLGIKLLGTDEKNDKYIDSTYSNIGTLKTYIETIIDIIFLQYERININKKYIKQTLPIYTGNINSTDFNISKEIRKYLINCGINDAKKYFKL